MGRVLEYLSSPNSQWIWGAAQSLFLVIGFAFVVRQIRLAHDQNSITHLNYFRDLWNSAPLLRSRVAFLEHPLESEGPLLAHEDLIVTFMNDLGMAVKAGQADKEHVWSYFGYYVESYWLLLSEKIRLFRLKRSDPNYFINFENLHTMVREMNAKRGSPALDATHVDVFRREESVLGCFLLNTPSEKPQSG